MDALAAIKAENGSTDEADWLTPIMIGDDARDDVIGAQKIGFRGILVNSFFELPT